MKIQKNPLYALALSLMPGLGQIYNGELRKGYLMMVGAAVAALMGAGMGTMGWVLILTLWLVIALEAYHSAAKTAGGRVVTRDPYLALALSHILDGAGQLYNGELIRGLVLSAGGLTSCLLTLFLVTRKTPIRAFFDNQGKHVLSANVLITWLMIALAMRLFALLDAYFTARNRLDDYLPKG